MKTDVAIYLTPLLVHVEQPCRTTIFQKNLWRVVSENFRKLSF